MHKAGAKAQVQKPLVSKLVHKFPFANNYMLNYTPNYTNSFETLCSSSQQGLQHFFKNSFVL